MNNDVQNEEELIQEEFLHGNVEMDEEMYPEDNKKANILCLIALGCDVLPLLVFAVAKTLSLSVLNIVAGVTSVLGILLMIAGIVIMIIVRVKYPDNLFGKVLMWVYIVLLIVAAVAYIISMIVCTLAMYTCIYSCMNCNEFCPMP